MSATGSVLAIACTAVKPPIAAARVPVIDGLGVLAARLAQVGVQVDQARQRDQPGRVDDLEVARLVPVAVGDDPAVLEQEVVGAPPRIAAPLIR